MAPYDSPKQCTSAGRVTARLLLSFLAFSSPIYALSNSKSAVQPVPNLDQLPVMTPHFPDPAHDARLWDAERFTLRHLFHHGTYLHPWLHRRKDILNPEAQLFTTAEDGRKEQLPPLMIRSQSTRIERLVDRRPSVVDPMVAAAREYGETWTMSPAAWTLDDVPGPNITDKGTVLSLAQMAANAYVEEPYTGKWENISIGFNSSNDFGWESDGLRGHVWANEDNSTIIISMKGTTTAIWDGDGTTTNDKENDNLLFGCCCGQQGPLTQRTVCECASGTYSCNTTCVVKALRKENRYYAAARELYSNVTELYPDSNVWVSGHSLGGAVSSLLGMTYGLPTVTFEAPPERLAAKRLGLPIPPSANPLVPYSGDYTGTYHFGHTADPLYLGSCNGGTSLCSFAGYAMETACHAGLECVYDVVADKGWRVGLSTHSILSVIHDVIMKYDTVPTCVPTPECEDCPLWKFYNSNSSDTTTTTSSTSTKTRTRTETCKTPGWWGCLDETTTTGKTTTSEVSTTTSTSTCKTPGWFGCKDKTTTTSSSGSFIPTATMTSTTCSSTTSCKTPGWFGGCRDSTTSISSTSAADCQTPGFWGCKDKSTPSITPPITSPPPMPTITSKPSSPPAKPSKHKCTSRAWFGLICVDPSPTETTVPTATMTCQPSPSPHCVRRSWLGYCKEWNDSNEASGEEL